MNIKKIIITLLIIAAIGFLLQQKFIREPVLNFLNENIPWSIPTFTYIKDNISAGTLIGLLLYLIFVSIPLLPSPPAEAYTIFSLSKGTNIFGIVFITILVYMVFAVMIYFIGRFFGKRMLEKMLKRTVNHHPILDRLIVPLIFFAYIIPIPLPIPLATITVLFAGFYKSELIRVLAAVGVGTLFRLILTITLYQYLPFDSWLKFG